MSFLYAYSSNHQVWMAKEDEEKNELHHTPGDILLHMNALQLEKYGVTITCLVCQVLASQIG